MGLVAGLLYGAAPPPGELEKRGSKMYVSGANPAPGGPFRSTISPVDGTSATLPSNSTTPAPAGFGAAANAARLALDAVVIEGRAAAYGGSPYTPVWTESIAGSVSDDTAPTVAPTVVPMGLAATLESALQPMGGAGVGFSLGTPEWSQFTMGGVSMSFLGWAALGLGLAGLISAVRGPR